MGLFRHVNIEVLPSILGPTEIKIIFKKYNNEEVKGEYFTVYSKVLVSSEPF